MKRTVQIIIFTFILIFILLSHSVPRAYATTVYGSEGSTMNSMNSAMVGLIWNTVGACEEGSTISAPRTDVDYMTGQTALDVMQIYYSNQQCPKNVSYGHSTIAALSNVGLALYTHPPATTRDFAIDLGQTLGFIPQHVEAQGIGIGYAGLRSLLPIWKAFRNVAYALLSVILLVVGFMIMFRKKIDPKTVVTVQNAIPRIIIALLLVTFSYAIVGFVIDLMYLSIILAVNLIVPEVNSDPTTAHAFNVLISNCTWRLVFAWPPVQCIPNATQVSPQQMTGFLLNGGLGGFMQMFFGSGIKAYNSIVDLITGGSTLTKVEYAGGLGVIGLLLGGAKGAAIGLASGPILLYLIVVIALIFGVVRLVFMLIDAYINIIISLIFSPFQLMMEAIPGTNSFSGWFRWLIAKVITFPITAVLLMVAALLTAQANTDNPVLWGPPLLSTGGGTLGMAGIVGLGLLLVIPNVVGGIQKSLKAEPFIPGGLGTIFGPVGAGVGQLTQIIYQASFISSALRHKPDERNAMQTVREGSQKGFGALSGPGGEGH